MSTLDRLSTPSKSKSVRGSLASLWRRVLKDLDMISKLQALKANYAHKNRNKSKGVLRASSLNSASMADEISLNQLLNLLQHLVNVKRIDITITLTHNSNKKTSHTETFFNKETNNEIDEKEN